VVQRFLAILLIVAGLGGIGYGIATATVLRESDTVVATATPSGDGTMVVTEPGVLGLVDDQVTVRATVPEGQKVTLALGSDVDVLGWVGDDPYDSVTGLSSWEALSVVPGTGLDTAAEEGEEKDEGPAEKPASGPDPAGSDMWLSEVTGETTVSMRWTEEPGRVVLLAAGVGKNAEAPTLELTWPRPVNTPYLWPGVLGGGFLLILGVFIAIGARSKGNSKKNGSGKGRTPSTVRPRRPDSDLPRRGVAFDLDEDRSTPSAHETPESPQPTPDDPADGGTAVFPPAGPLRPGRGAPRPSPQPQPQPEPEPVRAWSPPAPFGGAAPITPPPTPEPASAPEPVAAPAASIRGIRRSRRAQNPGAAPAQAPVPASSPAQRPSFGDAAPERTPAPSEAPAPAQAAPAAPSGRPMTRREMRLREQAQRRAATGAMPAVPVSEPEPEPEVEQPQTPSSRAAAWRQTWGVTGDGDNNR